MSGAQGDFNLPKMMGILGDGQEPRKYLSDVMAGCDVSLREMEFAMLESDGCSSTSERSSMGSSTNHENNENEYLYVAAGLSEEDSLMEGTALPISMREDQKSQVALDPPVDEGTVVVRRRPKQPGLGRHKVNQEPFDLRQSIRFATEQLEALQASEKQAGDESQSLECKAMSATIEAQRKTLLHLQQQLALMEKRAREAEQAAELLRAQTVVIVVPPPPPSPLASKTASLSMAPPPPPPPPFMGMAPPPPPPPPMMQLAPAAVSVASTGGSLAQALLARQGSLKKTATDGLLPAKEGGVQAGAPLVSADVLAQRAQRMKSAEEIDEEQRRRRAERVTAASPSVVLRARAHTVGAKPAVSETNVPVDFRAHLKPVSQPGPSGSRPVVSADRKPIPPPITPRKKGGVAQTISPQPKQESPIAKPRPAPRMRAETTPTSPQVATVMFVRSLPSTEGKKNRAVRVIDEVPFSSQA